MRARTWGPAAGEATDVRPTKLSEMYPATAHTQAHRAREGPDSCRSRGETVSAASARTCERTAGLVAILQEARATMPDALVKSALLVLVLSLWCSGCSSLSSSDFASATPRFEPEKFFEGPVRSWGVVETRGGLPKSRLRADLSGHRDGDDLVLTQDFTFEDGRKQRRVWNIRRIDDHRYEAVSSDVSGSSVGHASGNTFHWIYYLQLRPGNRLSRVRMEHWMYLLGDGETMINRVTIRKFGFVLAQTTEYFRRGQAPVPSVER